LADLSEKIVFGWVSGPRRIAESAPIYTTVAADASDLSRFPGIFFDGTGTPTGRTPVVHDYRPAGGLTLEKST